VTESKPRQLFAAALTATSLLVGCGGWRPTRFADRPPVTTVHDDAAIDLPQRVGFIDELYQADVYIRRTIVKGLDPRRIPDALDANSIDDVPRSSWYRGAIDPGRPLRGYVRDGPPQSPFTRLDDPTAHRDAYRVVDARGLDYELLPDVDDRPGMRTGADAITSRLVYALGYHTPEVYIVHDESEGEPVRVAATRWPLGIDLGPTPINRLREDDPNDHLPHVERRTLRVMKLVAAWLDLPHLRPRMFRDAYRGEPGRGHVEHHVMGFSGSLGVGVWQDEVNFANDPDRQDRNFFFKLFTMGLSPKPPGYFPQTQWPSVGLFHEHVLPKRYKITPPFEPTDRMTRGDAYWIAKRIAAIPLTTLAKSLAAAEIDDAPTNWLFQLLHLRRAEIVAWGYDQTTPLDLMALRPRRPQSKKNPSSELVLADLAIDGGFLDPKRRRYQVRIHDADGRRVMQERVQRPVGSLVTVSLPHRLREHGYLVVRIRAKVDDAPLPRHLEVHLRPSDDGFRVIGLRH
jgi:hypothetical protein